MPDDDSDFHINELLRREARETVNQQTKRIENFDNKSIGIFRANLFLTGILLTGFSLVYRPSNHSPNDFINVWTVFGALFLLLSTIFAAVAYTSSSYDIGVSPAFIDRLKDSTTDRNGFSEEILPLYEEWMNHNENVNKFNKYVVTIALILVLNSLVFFPLGTVVGLKGYAGSIWSNLAFIGVVIGIVLLDIGIWLSESVYSKFYKG